MRVITGSARGCRLEAPEGQTTRPTAERVKEGLFSAIQFDIPGRRVLDAFAGSGQLGIEALSRGAAHCVFIDRNADAAETVRRNLRAAKLADRGQVLTAQAEPFLTNTREKFDLIFLDPPYADDRLPDLLCTAAPRVAAGGLVVCEADAGQALPESAGSLSLHRMYRYGRVHIHIYRYREEQV